MLKRRRRSIITRRLLPKPAAAPPAATLLHFSADPSLALAWPAEIAAAFAISIRPPRFQALQQRLGPWREHVQLWNGTNGMHLKAAAWKQMKKVAAHSVLRAGEIGCYDSHVRIWEHIVEKKLGVTLILEDDANIRYVSEHATRLRQTFDEIQRLGTAWDLLYIGGKGTKSRNVSPLISIPRHCNGLFAYCLTLQGAQLLLARAKPYTIPVDVLVAELSDSRYLKAIAMDPPLCYVVPVHSDTVHIR
jgi:GR25 family glycosyltransferase involved in LPS biosynthesis